MDTAHSLTRVQPGLRAQVKSGLLQSKCRFFRLTIACFLGATSKLLIPQPNVLFGPSHLTEEHSIWRQMLNSGLWTGPLRLDAYLFSFKWIWVWDVIHFLQRKREEHDSKTFAPYEAWVASFHSKIKSIRELMQRYQKAEHNYETSKSDLQHGIQRN